MKGKGVTAQDLLKIYACFVLEFYKMYWKNVLECTGISKFRVGGHPVIIMVTITISSGSMTMIINKNITIIRMSTNLQV